MNSKLRQKLIHPFIFLIVCFFTFASFSQSIFAKSYTTYSNKKLHSSISIPASSRSDIKHKGQNCVEIEINFNITIRMSYGDIYEETLRNNKKTKKEVSKDKIYIDSSYVSKTWNNETYIKKYFSEILKDAKAKYSSSISKAKLSGIPAWKCHYQGKNIKSSGDYYLTVVNGGLYVLQIDSYLKPLSSNAGTVKKLKNSYTITNLVLPKTEKEEKAEKKKNKKAAVAVKDNSDDTDTTQTIHKDAVKDVSSTSLVVTGIVFGIIIGLAFIFGFAKKSFKNLNKAKNKEQRAKERENNKRKNPFEDYEGVNKVYTVTDLNKKNTFLGKIEYNLKDKIAHKKKKKQEKKSIKEDSNVDNSINNNAPINHNTGSNNVNRTSKGKAQGRNPNNTNSNGTRVNNAPLVNEQNNTKRRRVKPVNTNGQNSNQNQSPSPRRARPEKNNLQNPSLQQGQRAPKRENLNSGNRPSGSNGVNTKTRKTNNATKTNGQRPRIAGAKRVNPSSTNRVRRPNPNKPNNPNNK